MRNLFLAAAAALSLATAASAADLSVRPAIDGVLSAFSTHALVGLSDRHQLAQAGAFYAALVRDPRFAETVGNVVVEFGGAAHQDTLDRYLAGEAVPYEQLRLIWTDVVGWTPAEIGQMYPDFFASVRAANAGLPPDRRIRVWLGEPPIDWSRIANDRDLEPFMSQRDAHPTGVIAREILGKGRKALVIYGGAHFFSGPPFPTNIKAGIEKDHPGAFFIVSIHAGSPRPGCDAAFEARTSGWRSPALAAPIAGTWIEVALRDPACAPALPKRVGGPPISPEMLARRQDMATGVLGDALLYLGPGATLTRTPYRQDLYLDDAYRQEAERRSQILSGRPLPPTEALDSNTRSATPFDR